jgi:hypothetical protein
MKIWPDNKTLFGHVRLRHYNHNFYFPNNMGRWYVCLWWREIALVCLMGLLCGCSIIRVRDEEHKIFTTLYTPAYPWSNQEKMIGRLSVTYRTNGLTITMHDYGESMSNTNLAPIIEAVVTGVVKGIK